MCIKRKVHEILSVLIMNLAVDHIMMNVIASKNFLNSLTEIRKRELKKLLKRLKKEKIYTTKNQEIKFVNIFMRMVSM